MLIEISEDIFKKSVDNRSLNYLLLVASYKGRYSVLVEIMKVKNSSLYKNLSQIDKKFIEENFKAVVTNSKKTDIKISNKNKNISFDMNEAIRYLLQPVSIVLENSLNDSYFIRTLIGKIGKVSNSELDKHLRNGWLQIENSGGCTNIINFLEGKMQSYNFLPKNNNRYLRCFVLLDGDNKAPTIKINPKYSTIESFLNTNNVPYHILEKRSMENYLPMEVFDFLKKDNNFYRWLVSELNLNSRLAANLNRNYIKWANVFLTLSPLQLDFIDISKGITKRLKDGKSEKRKKLKPEILKLYKSISQQNFYIINKGLELPNFKKKFPLLFLHHQVHEKSLKDRTKHQNNPNELSSILTTIKNLI